MPLVTVPFAPDVARPAPHVRRFLRVASRRVARLGDRLHIPALVSSDFGVAYAALLHLRASGLAPGDRLAEWGSGPGVVTCLAALAGFDACGIEVRGGLVRAARRLAADFGLPAEFARGSFIPEAGRGLLAGGGFARLDTGGPCGHGAMGASVGDFDVVYAYPWPDEERLVGLLFEGHARPGALLMTYGGECGITLRRKCPTGAPAA